MPANHTAQLLCNYNSEATDFKNQSVCDVKKLVLCIPHVPEKDPFLGGSRCGHKFSIFSRMFFDDKHLRPSWRQLSWRAGEGEVQGPRLQTASDGPMTPVNTAEATALPLYSLHLCSAHPQRPLHYLNNNSDLGVLTDSKLGRWAVCVHWWISVTKFCLCFQ